MQISLLGGVTITSQSGNKIKLQQKVIALLVYLVLEGNRSHSRESLMGLLWPELDEASARNNLRVTLARLRKGLQKAGVDPVLIFSDRKEVQFRPDDSIQIDLVQFQTLLEQGQRVEAAGLYAGPFMRGFFLDGCSEFEEWLFVRRERLHLQVMGLLEALGDGLELDGSFENSLVHTQRQLELDPLYLTAQYRLLRLLAHLGKPQVALKQYQRFCDLFESELGVEPDQQMVELVEQISNGTFATNQLPPNNLPENLTPFFGREAEFTSLSGRLEKRDYRLITLVGQGGIGKSRLGVEVARANLHLFPDGAFFIPLAPIDQSDVVPSVIAKAVNFTFAPSEKPQGAQLVEYLAPKNMLLVIDNLEHLVETDVADFLLELLNSCRQVVLLVTSRESLNFQAEDTFILSGLPYPSSNLASSASEGKSSTAVQLFCDRAHRLDKSFKLTAENHADVVSICQTVGGLPLALELAASSVRRMSLATLATTIAKNIDLLAVRFRDVEPRHRSIRAVFEVSWRLLKSEEQLLLAKLSVFRGGFSTEAVEEVSGAVRFQLERLEAQSLIRYLGDNRYDLHGLHRQFAAEKLANQFAETVQVQHNHAAYYLNQVAQSEATLSGPDMLLVMGRIQPDIANFRTAWQFSFDHARWHSLNEALIGWVRFLTNRLLWQEAVTLCRRGLKKLEKYDRETTQSQFYRNLLSQLGELLSHLKQAESVTVSTEALNLSEQADDYYLIAFNNLALARAHLNAGQIDSDQHFLDYAEKISTEHGIDEQLVQVFIDRGHIAFVKDQVEKARQYTQEALELIEKTGLCYDMLPTVYGQLGNVAFAQQVYERAIEYQKKGLEVCQELGKLRREAVALHFLAIVYGAVGRYECAIECELRGLKIFEDIQDRDMQSFVSHTLALCFQFVNNFEEAAVYGQAAVDLAADTSIIAKGYADVVLAKVLFEQGALSKAKSKFNLAKAHFLKLGRMADVYEAQLGLALIACREAQADVALEMIEPILADLPDNGRESWENPAYVFLSGCQILAANQDIRAGDVLSRGKRYINKIAENISDEEMRRSFIYNVRDNRELLDIVINERHAE